LKYTEGWLVKDRVYLIGFLAVAGLLLFIGRDQLPSATFLTWGFTFGATTAAAVLIVSLYRVQLELKHSRHELARKDAELNFAREVQRALFPARLPEGGDLTFSAICIPAQGISGDFYDVLECEDGRTIFAVADVSGKGISAAILMANVQAVLRTLIKASFSLDQVCSELNDHLYKVTEPSKFATFFVAQWLPDSCELEYVNAGHQTPVLSGSVKGLELRKGGPPIGMFPDIVYESGKVKLRDSDLIAVYSDGLSEATSSDDVEFGDSRLSQLVKTHHNASLADIQSKILDAVSAWSGRGREPEDDMTVVLVRVGSGNGGGGEQG
jgi:sigma-B regulation protein RsbU (phosphoserine phosphatase)